jgi:hypothetical protein
VPGALVRGVFGPPKVSGHRSFTAYDRSESSVYCHRTVQQLGELGVDPAAARVMAAGRGHFGDELATVNPLVDGGQRNLGLTSDSSQFVCHRIECAQRV